MQANPNPRNGSHQFSSFHQPGEPGTFSNRDEKDVAGAGARFFEATCEAVGNAGCELLFEVPVAVFDEPGERAVAIRRKDAQNSLCFLLLRPEEGVVSVVTAGEAPQTAIEFTRAYVNVLSLMASDRNVTAPLIQ